MVKYLTFLILVGCSDGGQEVSDFIFKAKLPGEDPTLSNRLPVVIDDEFKPFVGTFEGITNTKVAIRIQFDKLESATQIGVCFSWTDGNREVYIDRATWPTLSTLGKEQLILHELGHCILNRPHLEELVNIGGYKKIPKSIMHPYHFGNNLFYDKNHSYYTNELVGGK